MKQQKWVHWPSLQDELTPHLHYLEGKVLNAGGGKREICIPNASEIINMDLNPMEGVDIVGDLESIPLANNSFDSILNVAVLEHVRRPWIVVKEFHRILKNNGKLLCVVPFFQPIHYVPTDFFRFTPEGITALLEDANFVIDQCQNTHSIWHTIGWMGEEISKEKGNWWKYAVSPVAKLVRALSKYNKQTCKSFPNAITIYARKKDSSDSAEPQNDESTI